MISKNDKRRNYSILKLAREYLCKRSKSTDEDKRSAYLLKARGLMEDIGSDKRGALNKLTDSELLQVINKILKS